MPLVFRFEGPLALFVTDAFLCPLFACARDADFDFGATFLVRFLDAPMAAPEVRSVTVPTTGSPKTVPAHGAPFFCLSLSSIAVSPAKKNSIFLASLAGNGRPRFMHFCCV